MPILEFEYVESFKDWISDFTKPERYVFYVTSIDEIIAQPLKTSRPIVYGYMRVKPEEMKTIMEKITKLGFKIIRLKTFNWDTERMPGLRSVRED